MARAGLALLLSLGLLRAQTDRLSWLRIGNEAVDIALAAPATGPVDTVWFSADGSRLYARTRAGSILETQDFEHWMPAAGAPPQPADPAVSAVSGKIPAANARLVAATASGRLFALAKDVYRSDDGGSTWTDLTAYRNESIIGTGQHSLAVSPADPDHVVVANDFGVWRSLDGGLSWSGLNQFLPNLPARRILSTPNGATGIRILVDGFGPVEWQPGNPAGWEPADASLVGPEVRARGEYTAAVGALVTSFAAAGDTVYAGTADGRIFISFDRGRTFRNTTPEPLGGPVAGLFADPSAPQVALAAVAGTGERVLRTTNSGTFWDPLSSNLPAVPAHAVTADRASGAVYVATEAGVFYALTDLQAANPAPPSWTWLTGRLPGAAARDVKLDPTGNRLYVALDGYGVFATPAPHRARTVRLVNAADFSTRPAAPGSLVSVLGARVDSARAGTLAFPVLAASGSDSQIQVPFEATGPNLALALEAAGARYTVGLPVQPVSPAIFVSRDGTPMIQDADSGLMLDGRTPARSGARIQVFATGLGKVRPDWPAGLAAPLENAPAVAATVEAFLDRVPVEVTSATLAPGYVGFYLVELQLPSVVNTGPAELYLSAGGQESNRVRIYLEP